MLGREQFLQSEEARDLALACTNDYKPFLRESWKVLEPETPLEWGFHLDACCEHLTAVACGQIKNLLISMPPGSTKSRAVMVCWHPWLWTHEPHLKFLTSAGDLSLALRDSVAARRLIESDWYQARWGNVFSLTGDVNAKETYDNNRGGSRISLSVGGKVGGKKGHILLGDDLNDPVKVESAAERKAVIEWFDNGFWDRVNDFRTGRRVLVAHRVNDEDLLGHLLRGTGWDYLCIPEEYDPLRARVTSIGWSDPRQEPGQWLRPNRFAQEEKAAALARLGQRGYAARHGQAPVPLEGDIFRKDWFRYYEKHGEYYLYGGSSILESRCARFLTADLATSTDMRANWTCLCVWDDDRKGNLFLVEVVRRRIEGHQLVKLLWELYETWGLAWLGIEKYGFQLSVVQEARAKGLPVRALDKGKLSKEEHFSLAAQVRFEAGQIWFPAGAAFTHLCEEELLAFPRGQTDDLVDNCSYAAEYMTVNYKRRHGVTKPQTVGGMGKIVCAPWEDDRPVPFGEAGRPTGPFGNL